MTLRELMAADAALFTDPNDFGETVALYRDDGTSKEIDVIVNRQALEQDQSTGIVSPGTEVAIKVEDLVEFRDGDQIDVAPNIGGPVQRMRLRRVIEQDSVFFLVRLGS